MWDLMSLWLKNLYRARDSFMVEEQAPAKINLFLHIVGRRPDGYHEIETVFAFLAFGDRVRVWRSTDWSISLSGPFADGVPANGENLALRAARAFMARQSKPFAVSIEIDKQIPHAAGLGGGSADAGAVLRALNRLTETPLPQAELLDVAKGLGADVPACVRSQMCFATGVGEQLGPTLVAPGWSVLLCKPAILLNTRQVFLRYALLKQPFSMRQTHRIDVSDSAALVARTSNDLAIAAQDFAPELHALEAELAKLPGALMVRMSGSGPTFFMAASALADVAAWKKSNGILSTCWQKVTKLKNLPA
jgi:4-diphosphocytidyl-2-C-methyl-D-erythritol kinase